MTDESIYYIRESDLKKFEDSMSDINGSEVSVTEEKFENEKIILFMENGSDKVIGSLFIRNAKAIETSIAEGENVEKEIESPNMEIHNDSRKFFNLNGERLIKYLTNKPKKFKVVVQHKDQEIGIDIKRISVDYEKKQIVLSD